MSEDRIAELEAYIRMLELDYDARVDREVERRLPDAVEAKLKSDRQLTTKKMMDQLKLTEMLSNFETPDTWKSNPIPYRPVTMEVRKDRETNSPGFMNMKWGLDLISRDDETFMGMSTVNLT